MLNILLTESSNGSSKQNFGRKSLLDKGYSQEKHSLKKSMSIDISLIGVLSEPVMRGSYT